MITDDCDCGVMDWKALLHNGVIFIIGFFGMIYFMIYQRICADEGFRRSTSQCKFVYFGGETLGDEGVQTVYYTCFYAMLMVISIGGLFNVCCSKLGCMKIYAVSLLLIFFCITICDITTMAAIGTIYKGAQHFREFYTFQVFLSWFMQAAIITSAAYDAFYSQCKKQVYVKSRSPEVVIVSDQ
jgi:hypothetical protein